MKPKPEAASNATMTVTEVGVRAGEAFLLHGGLVTVIVSFPEVKGKGDKGGMGDLLERRAATSLLAGLEVVDIEQETGSFVGCLAGGEGGDGVRG
jgi:hypothetical protein